jgi:hypothetical protein
VANTFQQQARTRKLIYIVVILALAFLTYQLRENTWTAFGFPLGIRQQAESMEIREENLGEVELTDSTARLTLTGLRGFAVCGLWLAANEKQMKHEWNELEVLVKMVTKLQPHFKSPWLFQSWNLSYNVSVESDQVKDKYFYIAEGIKLLSRGERINNKDPDMRYYMGFYNQHKIGMADETNYLRCLYEMSTIDPKARDAQKLRGAFDDKGRPMVDLAKFEQFCKQNPMLVRRLRETLKKSTPAEIVDFLEANQDIPSMYEDLKPSALANDTLSTPLRAQEDRFPCLAPLPQEDNPANPTNPDFDNYAVARDWYTFAVNLMPEPNRNLSQFDPDYDRTRYRMPRYMMSIIFRQYPARGQTYIGERLEKEGWFDRDGWKITGDWFPDDKFSDGKEAVVGSGVDWAQRAYGRAHQMWRTHGVRTGLYLEPEEYKVLLDQAAPFRRENGLSNLDRLPDDGPDERWKSQGAQAHKRLYWLAHYQNVSNFLHFYFSTQVEQDPKCVELRKAFFQANEFRSAGEREAALDLYRTTLPKWRDLLLAHKEYRDDDNIQEDTYEFELRYRELVQSLYGARLKQIAMAQNMLTQMATGLQSGLMWLPPPLAARDLQVGIDSPVGGKDERGMELVPMTVKEQVRERLHLPPLRPKVAQAPIEPPVREPPIPKLPSKEPGATGGSKVVTPTTGKQ